MRVQVRPSELKGTLQVPGSKSHTIRCAVLSSLAKGESIIRNPLASGDGLSSLHAAQSFGISIQDSFDRWVVQGSGGNLSLPQTCIDTGNSGTTTCFFTSVASLVDGYTVITGDEQIRRRPIRILVDALNSLGAKAFLTRPNQTAPPVVIRGLLKGGDATIDGFNSQYVSSLLVSSALAKGSTTLTVRNALEKPYVRMTLEWMRRFGVVVENRHDCEHFVIEGGQTYRTPGVCSVPADWSAVAFPLVASCITNSSLHLTGLDYADMQGDKRVVDILKQMGAHISTQELEGTLHIEGGQRLKGGLVIDLGDIPDALPALVVAATQADGVTTFTNLAHVRIKETDRVQEMYEKLTLLGCDLQIDGDSLTVRGPSKIVGGEVSSSHDHRIAMALVCAGLAAQEQVVVTEAECAAVSFPNFFEKLMACGADLKLIEDGLV
ncbi:MAG: 3-phosphoshikimate 1-carboxyvinyltransferase [Sphaerochaeta sp.]|nr:3-phosphoshikimate 1-carboxyvinyltransferase [Sphaerochaeta sp.]